MSTGRDERICLDANVLRNRQIASPYSALMGSQMQTHIRPVLALHNAPTTIEIDASVTESGTISEHEAGRLIAAIVSQAYGDGMACIRLRFTPKANQMSMDYFGPKKGREQRWWSLTPPPIHSYLGVLRWLLNNVTFTGICPIKGDLSARLGRTQLDLKLRI